MRNPLSKYLIYCFLALFLFVPDKGIGQKTGFYYLYPDHRDALELYDKEKYAAAQTKFEQVIDNIGDPNDQIQAEAEYYSALCALNLFNKDAQYKLRKFIKDHPDSPWILPAYIQLGNYNYRRRDYRKCIHWFNKVEDYDLSTKQEVEKYFKKGYSYFKLDSFELASNSFFEIKDQPSDYFAPTNYYFAHIAYQQGNYQTALESFLKIQDHESFKEIVPYYLTQIYYLQEKYDKLISYAPNYLDSAGTKRTHEIARLIGDAYYRTGRFKQSVPYLEKYLEGRYGISREDYYQVGYACYRSGQYKDGLEYFKKTVDEDDSLAQTAYYHIANIYLDLEEKKYARNAFHSASNLFFDPEIRENSLFNYAKLSYELAFDPYHHAIKAFREYIEEYPDSDKIEEAYEYLTNLYMNSKNYSIALESLEKIENPNIRLQSAYQMIAFNRGVQLFQNQHYDQAILHFKKSRKYTTNRNLTAKSYFWEAEALSRKNKFKEAIGVYDEFQLTREAILLDVFPLSYYGKGYARFKQKEYDAAATSFRKFVDDNPKQCKKRINDAYLRIGDCYYVQKEYYKAVPHYKKGIEIGIMDADYGLFQVAQCKGLMKKEGEKIRVLKELIQEHSNSKYLADARFQLGRAYLKQEDNEKALAYFEEVMDKHPNSSYVKRAMLQKGLIHYRQEETNTALRIFKSIIQENPSYEASKEALDRIKDIYVDLGEMDEYNQFIAGLEGINISKKEVDQANYEAAEKKYMEGAYKAAIQSFEKYLEEFQPANFALNAHFYKAESEIKLELYEKALKDYEYVTQQPNNKFTEPALANAAKLNYREENYEKALSNFISLEKLAEFETNVRASQIGQMRCFHHLGNEQQALNYADKVLNMEKASNRVVTEALLIKGKSYMTMGEMEKAIVFLNKTNDTTSTEMGAEAKYLVAKIQHDWEKYKESEKEIFELIHQDPSYDHWVSRGFLLLAENYIKLGDLFQAKETLKSIIKNHDDPEMIQEAEEKLERVKRKEEEQKGEEELQENLEIDFEDVDPEYEKLYEREMGEGKREKGKGKKQNQPE